ncbi:MAG: hypothetical protein HKM89_10630, partial [Gemmatimonadales bacterium]|nr:hypothetical protein [Gemmatimonadales bacterium]
AFGMKLVIAGLPTLALIVLLRRPRLVRVAHTAVFFLTGFVVINFASYTPHELYRTLRSGIGDPYVYSRLTGILLYIVELPSIVSLPIAVLGLLGGLALARRALAPENRPRLPAILLSPFSPSRFMPISSPSGSIISHGTCCSSSRGLRWPQGGAWSGLAIG